MTVHILDIIFFFECWHNNRLTIVPLSFSLFQDDVAGNWRNYFKNTRYMTKTKSTTKHYKYKAYYTLESLYPTNVTDVIQMDLTQDPDSEDSQIPMETGNEYKWLVANRSIFNKLGRSRKAKKVSEHWKRVKQYKWEKRFNWTYCKVPVDKETYGKKPNIYLLYKSLLGGWKHNDLQQFWNIRLPNDGMI